VRFRPRYVRDRLTIWYVGVSAIVLAIYIAGAVGLLIWQLTSETYHAEIQDVETAEGLLYFTTDGKVAMQEDYHNHPAHRLLFDRLMEVLTPEGTVLYRNEKLQGRDLGGTPSPDEGLSNYDQRILRLVDGTQVLAISHVHAIDGKPLLIRLAYGTNPLVERVAEFLGLLLLALPIAVVASAIAAYRVAGKALNPLEQMARQTEQITASHLDERVQVENPDDELGHMARVLNGLLERLQQSFENIERFTSDVSHELRTPLASIRSVGEVGLEREHSAKRYRDIIGSMLEEVARLTHLVDTLLIMSRADAGQIELHRTAFLLFDLAREVTNLVSVVADEKQQNISLEGDDTVTVIADRMLLRQAILNILDNAVKYAPAQTMIRICLNGNFRTSANGRIAELSIENEGPAISDEDRTRIFDRFYRAAVTRSHNAGGIGLGLAIAKWAVEANGGEIGVRAGSSGGSSFYIRLETTRAISSEKG
jgi:heavy metal sensor kinase